MYDIKKQNELANIAYKIFKFYEKDYKKIASKILKKVEKEKKEKLENYLKIIMLSSSVKQEFDYELDKELDVNTNVLLGVLSAYELLISKSKEIKTDLRLKLFAELIDEIELNDRDKIRESHRELTKIIKG